MPTARYTLRPFRPDDTLKLLDLFKDTIRRVNARDYDADQIAAWSSDEIDPVAWGNRFEGRFAIVAEVDDCPVGFTDLTHEGYLDRLFVSANHQRQGIASALMDSILAEANRLGLNRIDVNVSLTARPFFESYGFEIVEVKVTEIRGASLPNFSMSLSLTH
jgi:GNAT superfamily N-acetyltransferase